MYKFVFCTCLLMYFAFQSENAFGEGTFHFYNTIDSDTSCYISVTGEETNRTAQSPRMVGFQQNWTTKLQGGRYRIKIKGRNWSKDLGWHDFGDLKEGTVFIGWSDEDWNLIPKTQADGSVTHEWVRLVAAPVGAPLKARKLEVFIESNEEGAVELGPPELLDSKPDGVRLGVNAHKCDEGIHIDSYDNGTPAEQCRLADGKRWILDAGEHILEVNGIAPGSIEEFRGLISDSPREMRLKVKDTNGKIWEMTTQLW